MFGIFGGAGTSMSLPSDGKKYRSYILQLNSMFHDNRNGGAYVDLLSDKFFKVRLEAWQTFPTEVSSQLKEFLIKAPKNIFNFDLIHSGASFSASHQHSWGGDGGRGALVNAGLDIAGIGSAGNLLDNINSKIAAGLNVLGTGATLAQSLKNLTSGKFTEAGEKAFQAAAEQAVNPYFSGLDITNTYQSSEPLEFQISCVFIAYDDPLREVVLPCKILEHIGYPTEDTLTRSTIIRLLNASGYNKNSNVPYDLNSMDGARHALTQLQEEHFKKHNSVKSTAPGVAQTRVGFVPPVWKATFSNGIHGIENCHLKSVNTTYYGPWLENPRIDKKQLASIQKEGGTFKDLAREIHGSADVFDNSIVEKLKSFQESPGGYPSYAEVQLTFKSNFEKPFGEDVVLAALGNYSKVTHSTNGSPNI